MAPTAKMPAVWSRISRCPPDLLALDVHAPSAIGPVWGRREHSIMSIGRRRVPSEPSPGAVERPSFLRSRDLATMNCCVASPVPSSGHEAGAPLSRRAVVSHALGLVRPSARSSGPIPAESPPPTYRFLRRSRRFSRGVQLRALERSSPSPFSRRAGSSDAERERGLVRMLPWRSRRKTPSSVLSGGHFCPNAGGAEGLDA